MKILLLSPNDWGGANCLLARGFSLLTEHTAESVTEMYHPFRYDTQTVVSQLDESGRKALEDRIRSADFIYIAQGGLPTYGGLISSLIDSGRTPFLIRHSGSDIRNMADLRFEHQLSKKFYWSFTAYDYSMTRCLVQSLQHNTHILDVDKWHPPESAKDPDAPVFIYHSPTNNAYKGTNYIDAAIQRLSKKYNIEWRHTGCDSSGKGGKPWHSIMREKSKADIFVDSILDEAHGQNAAEAMCFGIPTLTSVGPYYRSIYPDTPIVNTNTDNIEENLEGLIANPDLRNEIGMRTREYAIKTFSVQARVRMWAPIIEFICKPDVHEKWTVPKYWKNRGTI